MKPTQELYNLGQSLWLDDLSRGLLNDGRLRTYIKYYSLTGLTSNPTIFEHAISKSRDYDNDILLGASRGWSTEGIFFNLALKDLREAAREFLPVHERTCGVDGWVSLEVSPLLANDADGSIKAATRLHDEGARSNIFIKIPGTPEGVKAIEESIFQGVPINVTLLFSSEQYQAASEAYLRGIERRIEKGLGPDVPSVASLFISRWDVAVKDKVPENLQNKLGIAVGQKTYKAYLEMLNSPRVRRLMNLGMRPQRLLWASTGTKDPKASDTLYIEALNAPLTINTIPEKTLKAFADHGKVGPVLTGDNRFEQTLKEFSNLGIDLKSLATQLQVEGTKSFEKSWSSLMTRIDEKKNYSSPHSSL